MRTIRYIANGNVEKNYASWAHYCQKLEADDDKHEADHKKLIYNTFHDRLADVADCETPKVSLANLNVPA